MSYLTAQFPDQRSAMAAMDKIIGRGLGQARIHAVDHAEEPNGQTASPRQLGEAGLEIQFADGAGDGEIRSLLSSLGATHIATNDKTDTPFPAAPGAPAGERGDVSRAIEASERGAIGTAGVTHDLRVEKTATDKRTRHDPQR